ncbi:hypothetical protein DSO57_1011249 [Entomophthora muscae]|uniref:Uncharacterized protein n=1 Tax=Entomophthora muscae TaxID=34485 RepID=A0ACC2RX68_9FUNG|nr:hypothetical protein DSO57_1011249 [Entomophthora muscae]
MRKREKLLSSQVTEKPLTAISNDSSPKIDPDLNAKELPDEETSLMDPATSPERYLPEKEELNKNLLNQVLSVNAVTRKQAIHTEALLFCEAIETVSTLMLNNFHIPLVK